MRMPRWWSSLTEKVMRLARRRPRGVLAAGIVCLVIAFLPYYSHSAAAGPAEVDLPFFGKVKGPPERTHFHVGLPWSPWVKYWRVLEYQGPFNFNYSYGYNFEIFCGSAVPALLGTALLFVRRRARRARGAELAQTTATGDEASTPNSSA